MTLPLGLAGTNRGQIKRPDFLVGIPPIGRLAFDAKAKTVYRHRILIDAAEHAALLQFEQLLLHRRLVHLLSPKRSAWLPPFHEPGDCGHRAGEAGRGGVHRPCR
jgi:hypothetical protein